MTNRTELMELTRKANDGVIEAENILDYCKGEARRGRGAFTYYTNTPKEQTLRLIHAVGMDAVFDPNSHQLVIVWDQEAEDRYQARQLLNRTSSISVDLTGTEITNNEWVMDSTPVETHRG